MSGRYLPKPGDCVQLWHATRRLFPFHAQCGTVVICHGTPLNALVRLDTGGSVVGPRGNLREPQPEPQQELTWI
jgi:hypothetical protein